MINLILNILLLMMMSIIVDDFINCEDEQICFFLKLNRENKIFGIFPSIRFNDKSTYTESQTKKYDLVSFSACSFHE